MGIGLQRTGMLAANFPEVQGRLPGTAEVSPVIRAEAGEGNKARERVLYPEVHRQEGQAKKMRMRGGALPATSRAAVAAQQAHAVEDEEQGEDLGVLLSAGPPSGQLFVRPLRGQPFV
ncbi:MAG: hypothetical protein LAN84_17280 [Acidobacteriia bacterium]|nr:hypothetical protein [Terriglobia bacterium]